MEFTTNGRKFVLWGAKTPSFKLINNKTFAEAVNKGAELCFLSTSNATYSFEVNTCHTMSTQSQTHVLPEAIATMIIKYADIFEELVVLPPIHSGFNHKIPLKEGSNLSTYALIVCSIKRVSNTYGNKSLMHLFNMSGYPNLLFFILAADALSRKEGVELLALFLTNPSLDLWESIKSDWHHD
ncbi:unnamed protein product [Vicia faba]|uniref:Uncharacterized protein n=1 Tax=Vicia faba TaxID=3906 RepID=A0AAV0ZTI6_VICFA|nr:unnamed protein product [Vicia faba]